MAELTKEFFEQYMDTFAGTVKEGFDSVDERFDGVEQRLTNVEQRVTKISATMVTKDYLDDKLADLRGDLVVLMRKEDTKLKKLVERLRAKNVLDDADVREIVRMEPFAALS